MMAYDRQITISTAGSRKAVKWPPSTLWWSELVDRLRVPTRGMETLAAYLALAKPKQDELKDVGGYVAGTLQGNRRKAKAVNSREIVTIDADSIPAGGTADILRRIEGLGCGYCVYSTRKHEEARPRLRILLPLSRPCSADEYEPIARKLAALIDPSMAICDPTTFEASRLMYWPSCCADSQYVFSFSDKPFVDVDGVLSLYRDWRNVAEWPQVPGVDQAQQRLATKQGDPTTKPGVVGAFCRTYDIYRTLDELIPGVYAPTDIPDRYTFAGGSTTGGAVVYDHGQFLFSHHATDPCSGKLVNSFDLVRLHRFGDQDDDVLPGTPTNRLPSYTLMCQFAVADSGVASLLNTERYEMAVEAFTGSPVEVDTVSWMSKLAISATTGAPAKTVDNVLIILEHDPLLRDRIAFDEFANRGLALSALPWDSRVGRRQWTDTDDAGLRHYIEKVYGITGKDRLLDATALCAFRRRINDVQDYLTGLQWDGVKRVDTLLIDYLGAEDNPYTRAVMRKSLAAAVARAMQPGVKYDYMPILTGPQGIGKSTFLRLLGSRWYSDSLSTFEGKEAREMVQGTWINEIGELNGMTRSEITAVKQFLSQQDDIYREPYGRRTNNFPRRCVFFGTTNDTEFLRDRTGNRRFWPVDVGVKPPAKNVFKELPDQVNDIWAEAFAAWQVGEPLYLSGEAERISMEQQEEHRESNAKEGIIREFLDRPIPIDWDNRDVSARRMYWSGGFSHQGVETTRRARICAAELWCECLGGDVKFMKRSDSVELYGILSGLPGWERHPSTLRFGPYGTQKGFVRNPQTL